MEEKVEAQDHRKETASLSLCSHSVFCLQTVKILLIDPVWVEGVALGFRVLFCFFKTRSHAGKLPFDSVAKDDLNFISLVSISQKLGLQPTTPSSGF